MAHISHLTRVWVTDNDRSLAAVAQEAVGAPVERSMIPLLQGRADEVEEDGGGRRDERESVCLPPSETHIHNTTRLAYFRITHIPTQFKRAAVYADRAVENGITHAEGSQAHATVRMPSVPPPNPKHPKSNPNVEPSLTGQSQKLGMSAS
jgi:hypothetical protein